MALTLSICHAQAITLHLLITKGLNGIRSQTKAPQENSSHGAPFKMDDKANNNIPHQRYKCASLAPTAPHTRHHPFLVEFSQSEELPTNKYPGERSSTNQADSVAEHRRALLNFRRRRRRHVASASVCDAEPTPPTVYFYP